MAAPRRPWHARSLSPEQYRTVTLAALWLLAFIVVTGAAVRLTGSGLGCTDWPTCNDERVVAELDFHPMVEFTNRVITGLVSAAVIVAVLGSRLRRPRRRDLTWLSLGLVAGVIAQIVLGGIVVLTHLNPVLVQGHFILSMVLVLNAVVLHDRAGRPDGSRPSPADPLHRRIGWALTGLTALVLLTGTVVTGSGPHSGQARGEDPVRRLGFDVGSVARIHSATVWALLAATLGTAYVLRRSSRWSELQRPVEELLVVLVLQGVVGYTQYFTEVPPLLVGLHVLGATLLWVWTLRLHLRLSRSAPAQPDSWGARRPPDGSDRDLVTR